jgi:hypothetical protein
MENNPEKYKEYDSINSLMEDLLKWSIQLKRLANLSKILNYV